MDQWTKSLREDRFPHRRSPSFSSTLLDAIYRSIDEGDQGEEELVLYRETMKKNQSNNGGNNSLRGASNNLKEEEMENFRRACMIEKWMEKKVSEKVVVRRKSLPDFNRKLLKDRSSMAFHSTSSSSDSSSGGGFSSSEAESAYGSRSRSSSLTSQRLKPVRTSASVPSERSLHFEQRSNVYGTHQYDRNSFPQQKPKHEGGFNKTKSRALKIYGDLKKVKQPISPGGRLASFLNSLFTAGSAKKAKMAEDVSSDRKSKSAQTSTCSSASSFSRSCLSKTPSSRGKPINGIKRSVRFYPVSVIVDEDSRPCGHKSLYEDEPNLMSLNEELKFHLVEKNRRVEEAARDLLKGYGITREKSDFDMRDFHDGYQDDDDDAASCSSSDLFELDNLSAIGIERYREELPVYETTHLATNRAIANGFIL